ncbi:hypothetical protein BST61_g11309 [Cercospora zeina]
MNCETSLCQESTGFVGAISAVGELETWMVDLSIHTAAIARLSAPSGIPTFQQLPAQWHGYTYASLSSHDTLESNPAVVWDFYERMRCMADRAQPNIAHQALAQLARVKAQLLTVSQNIDNLLERAGYPELQLQRIHGSLFKVVCSSPGCSFQQVNSGLDISATPSGSSGATDLGSPRFRAAPTCPECKEHAVRPAITLFGEMLAEGTLERIDHWMDEYGDVDLLLVIGTRGYTSSNFVTEARARGARVAHFDLQEQTAMFEEGDWFVQGDVASTLPSIVHAALSGCMVTGRH